MENFINIDEAQDISLSEYRLLRSILGDKCIFNLYGDIHQLIYSYKGIRDWDDLKDIISNNRYFLKENYRNTLQISEYCNRTFNFAMNPMGISGTEIKKWPFVLALNNLFGYFRENPDSRIAIIYRKGLDNIESEIKRNIPEEKYSLGTLQPNKISLLTVERAKGLEFEYVLVIENHMTENEKYVSFTRALDNLVVAKAVF